MDCLGKQEVSTGSANAEEPETAETRIQVAKKNELVCAVWKDTRVVIMLSNMHKATGAVRRRVHNQRQEANRQ